MFWGLLILWSRRFWLRSEGATLTQDPGQRREKKGKYSTVLLFSNKIIGAWLRFLRPTQVWKRNALYRNRKPCNNVPSSVPVYLTYLFMNLLWKSDRSIS